VKAMTYSAHGGSDQLTVDDIDLPVAGPGEALVRVQAAGVNPVDVSVREGHLESVMPTTFPAVPGWDLAGVVEAVGEGVTTLVPGDEVWGYARRDVVHQGTYANFAAVQVTSLGVRPAGLDVLAAGALPLVGLTALQALRAVRVGPGDTVLINNASGGVGHVAIQIARALGATRVIGTAGEANRDFVRSLGAEAAEYGTTLEQVVRTLVPAGLDAALDAHGGPGLDAAFALVTDPSRVASIVDPGVAARGGQWVFCAPSTTDLEQLATWVDSGALTVAIEAVFTLADAAQAQDLVAAGHVRGKVVLEL